MAPAPPALPTRFPCWCRAVYSWGGETKRDLGFVEGDLIECLNAGDGSWWMGRLRRDRRMVGLFPSNFVKVLGEDFNPTARVRSPMPGTPSGGGTPLSGHSPSSTGDHSTGPSPEPERTRTKPYRKPFQAYARAGSPNTAALSKNVQSKPRDCSPNPPAHHQAISRPTSRIFTPEPKREMAHRAISPRPRSTYTYHPPSRPQSPYDGAHSSPPPPAPPPHRVTYTPHRPASSMHARNLIGYSSSRQPSPAPVSPKRLGQTPSPLRDAMEDVMSSLQDMGFSHNSVQQGPQPSMHPYSPEEVQPPIAYSPSRRKARPRSSLGIAGRDHDIDSDSDSLNDYPHGHVNNGPQATAYVQKPEASLRQARVSRRFPSEELFLSTGSKENNIAPPAVPPKNPQYIARPQSSIGRRGPGKGSTTSTKSLKTRRSAYDIGRDMIGRTFTTKSSATSSSSGTHSTVTSTSTQLTSKSIMSGHSAGGFSATSAGSLARKRLPVVNGHNTTISAGTNNGLSGGVAFDSHLSDGRPQTPMTGVTYHSSNESGHNPNNMAWQEHVTISAGPFGGLVAPKPKKSGFFKKMIESAKTGAATARSSIAAGQPTPPHSPLKSLIPNTGMSSVGYSSANRSAASNNANDWVQVRRDVNRSNSVSHNERLERRERCEMIDYPVISPIDILFESVDGDEGADGLPVAEPTNYQGLNLGLVDRNARFVNSIPPTINPISLAQGHVCRPYRSDAQRLRAIFTWVSEKISWEEDFVGEIDPRRVIQTRRGCAEEVAVLVMEMCAAVGIHAQVVRGYLKTPGEDFELAGVPHPNHWWNAVIVDGEWRMMDCSLASPTNPKRGQYSSAGSQAADIWWYLARPMEICYTHVPLLSEQQHICPPLSYEVLMALPCACAPYFRNNLQLVDFDTSLVRIEDLEQVHIQFFVPPDVECFAEVEAKAFERDADGDVFENGEVVRKRALTQADWVGSEKRYTVKALLPGDEGQGVLKVYAGKSGLMHSIKDNPHPLAFALPIIHTGSNPPYEFLLRHPTPYAQRHDLYVVQPQCARLVLNNTFVFSIRQHPSSLSGTPAPGSTSPIPLSRPSSALSMASSSVMGSSISGSSSQQKPAKLAIQAPSGKILKLLRKVDHAVPTAGPGRGEVGDGGVWETIIKCGERGVWRGLVLADRTARWCVFAEWDCL